MKALHTLLFLLFTYNLVGQNINEIVSKDFNEIKLCAASEYTPTEDILMRKMFSCLEDINQKHANKSKEFLDEYQKQSMLLFTATMDSFIESKVREYYISTDIIQKFNLKEESFGSSGSLSLVSNKGFLGDGILFISQDIYGKETISFDEKIASFEAKHDEPSSTKIIWKYKSETNYINSSTKLKGDPNGIPAQQAIQIYSNAEAIIVLISNDIITSELYIAFDDSITDKDLGLIISDCLSQLKIHK